MYLYITKAREDRCEWRLTCAACFTVQMVLWSIFHAPMTSRMDIRTSYDRFFHKRQKILKRIRFILCVIFEAMSKRLSPLVVVAYPEL
jgi:hypothetical protein